ncbi:MAG: MFS transporter [Spirochaetales bacterium]|nr:MFS transporter [Spirochaetales bacterium]
MENEVRKSGNVFSSRNFRLVFFGALVSELGALLYSFAVSFYILRISGNSAFLQGLYLALCGLAMLVFTPVGGVLGDRFNKAKIMYVCDYMKGGLIILATVLMLLFREEKAHIAILFGLGILGNAVSGVFSPVSGALLPHIVEEDRLQQANAYFSIKSSLESILGVILAGVLYAALPIHVLFFMVGICFVLSGISEMFIRYEHTPPQESLTLRVAMRDMRDGIAYLKTQKAVVVLLVAILFINFFFTPLTGNFMPFFISTDLSSAPSYLFDRVLTPEMWSSVVSVCFGISSLMGAAILSAGKQPEKCGFKVAVRLFLLGLAMTALTVSYWLLVDRGNSVNGFLIVFSSGALMFGFLISYINIPMSTALMRIVDREMLSKVNSITSIASQGMIPLASVLAGAVLQALGSTFLLAFCSLGFVVTAVLLLMNRRIREF